MGIAYCQLCRRLGGGFSGFNVRKKILVCSDVPDRVNAGLILIKEPEQGVTGHELLNEEISRLEILCHALKISIAA